MTARSSPPGIAHNRIVPSSIPSARVRPSGEKARHREVSVERSRSVLYSPDLQNQIATDPLPAARPEAVPSGENATACRSESCGRSTGLTDVPPVSRRMSQMRTISLQPQAARVVPSGETAILSTTCAGRPCAGTDLVDSTTVCVKTAEPVAARPATTVPHRMSWPIPTRKMPGDSPSICFSMSNSRFRTREPMHSEEFALKHENCP